MRRLVMTMAMVITLVVAVALPAFAPVEKFTFNDVLLPDGQTGEIEAAVKVLKDKDDSINCSYFTDDYVESLGYYFDFVEPAPLDPDAVLEFCLGNFDERSS